MKYGLLSFLRAFGARWFMTMSGPLSVPLAVAAYFVPNEFARIGLFVTAALCAFFSCYWAWRIERQERIELIATLDTLKRDERAIEIVFDASDPRCVREEKGLSDNIRVRRFWAGVKNASARRSVDEISMRARESQFVQCTVAIAHTLPNRRPQRNPVVLEVATLPPGAEEFVELFGLGGDNVYGEHDIMSKVQTFTLEARGRDAAMVTATLEYDPSTRPPTIRRIS
jgi:hypothetical protein